jgi:predicted dehydrogenase
LLAFLLQEGPVWPWRKAASFLLTQRVEKEQVLVIAIGKTWGTDRYCVGCGPQFSIRLPQMLFREELVFDVEDEARAFEMAQQIMGILQPRPELLRRLADFSPFSTEPAPALPGIERGATISVGPSPSTAAPKVAAPAAAATDDAEGNALFCIGAGAYAVVFVLPHLDRIPFDTVVEYNPLRAQVVARKFGFRHFETDYRHVLDRVASLGRIVVVVANYHSHHADTAIDFLKANPQACILIEKPAVVGYDQFERLLPYLKDPSYFVEIGFNRRYADMVRRAKGLLEGRKAPLAVTCLVQEDAMEPSHWYFWRTEGSRVYGNLCHWIDLGVHLIGSRPVELVNLADRDFQTASGVVVRFEDGSLLNLISGDQGDRLRGVQEYIDIRMGLLTVQIHDFRKMVVMHDGRRRVYRSLTRDKGHKQMYRTLSDSVLNSLRPRYPSTDFVRTSVLTEEIYRALVSGQRHCRLDTAAMVRWEGDVPPAAAKGHESQPDGCRIIVP